MSGFETYSSYAIKKSRGLSVILLGMLLLGLLPSKAVAQDDRYYPLNQYAPTGRAAQWASVLGQPRPQYAQPVRIHLPSAGEVTFYGVHPQSEAAPAMAGLNVGQVFRLGLTDMPEFPGVSLYPTIEMIDQLHPPTDEKLDFPVEIEVSAEEIEHVLDGGLVSKVIYLEQPQLAIPELQKTPSPTNLLRNHLNLLKEADRVGRPMLLFRMGSRQPAMDNPASPFYTPDSWVTKLPQKQSETAAKTGIARAISEEVETIDDHNKIYRTAATKRVSLKNSPGGMTERLYHYELYPDEYIVDGGDRGHPIHYENHALAGLESEDTVAEYQTQRGRNEVSVSNRVVIYSPRFRAMSVHQQPFARTALTKLGGVHDLSTGVGMDQSTLIDAQIQKSQLDGMRTRSRGSEMEHDTAFSGLIQNSYPTGHTKLQNVYQDLQYTQAGRFERMTSAQIKEGLKGAFVWSQSAFPHMAASTSAGVELESSFKAAEIVGIDIDKGKPGKLRIVKMADKVEARSGDIITFTIRYDNMGDHAVRAVRITDHLTPRLEYIEGSFKAEREGDVKFYPNGTEDSILRFEMVGELKGAEGSVLTFQARVR
ncbi:hypothetical protein Pla110_30640 [Polystyrenella longa]|uniref:DUF11 domain-containing protein n=1 Tax=Polystyrenella longa TaxID=2528007 RepID=A0A518CQ08_9PLAN|nr:DUF11 domain-containing protein [Polystyrenella longa]QDU81323.1 hypothetical protein Pla110_30640 [Polystyrenella longa]